MKKSLLLFCFIVSTLINSKAQPYFYRHSNYQVEINGNDISMPWAGGLNFVQASNIDLNFDGVNDLFLFDRSGNKVRTFINTGVVGAPDYTYAPQYEDNFPFLEEWALLADYNCDGKPDIYTHSKHLGASGIRVYKNISTTTTGLQFVLVTDLINSTYWPPNNNSKTGLYVSSVDLPSITDIDSDGDIDIVTFNIGGAYIEYHKNLSKETYGHCDSLLFNVKNHCWGYVSESYLTNFFNLNDTCIVNVSNPELVENKLNYREGKRHSGSCELCIDLNGDGAKEFIAGDISYKNLTKLNNNGTPTNAHFNSIDGAFPLNNGGTAVNLSVFPCGYYTDVNNDGKNDLIVSPNAPGSSENINSVVYYENIGTNNIPVFQYKQNNFLQENMIDVGEGAFPAIFDYDNDGLKDLFIGNNNYFHTAADTSKIALFKNIGTSTTPKFQLVTRDFNNYSSLDLINLSPAFGDMDGDGDADMIIGEDNGRLYYFTNTAAIGAPAFFVLTQANFKNSNNRIIDVGDEATPQIVDVDNDGKNDLIIGSRNGKLAYYKKLNATGAPQLDSITHYWGQINVTAPNRITGNSFPFVFKTAGKTELFVGSESGHIFRYDNIDGNLSGAFSLVNASFLNRIEGGNTTPTGADIDNDGIWDLFVGNYSGGLSFFKGSATSVNEIQNNSIWNFEFFPNPANEQITIHFYNTENKNFNIELFDMLGRLIIKKEISNSFFQLSVKEYNSGIYLLKVSEDITGNTIVKRVVVRH